MISITEALAQEFGLYSIDINAIYPGIINTKMMEKTIMERFALLFEGEPNNTIKRKDLK